jgi:putative hemolysin
MTVNVAARKAELTVRPAADSAEVAAAQALRYRVFYEELARAS